MELLRSLLTPSVGVVIIAVLFAMQILALLGMWRQRLWRRRMQIIQSAPQAVTQQHIQQAQSAERASDFFDALMRRVYYVLIVACALGLVTLHAFAVDTGLRFNIWLVLEAVTLGSALILLSYWRGRSDELEGGLRAQLKLAEERLIASEYSLTVRDPATNLYTVDFWLEALGLMLRKRSRRWMPITCLLIEIVGLEALRAERGDQAGERLLKTMGQAIAQNVRQTDIVCRSGDDRFAVALLRCPARFGLQVGERVASNVEFLTVEPTNLNLGSRLSVAWTVRTLPGDAATPALLLETASLDLN